MIFLLILLLILFFLWLMALRGSGRREKMEPFRNHLYAHRGLYGGAVPENSLSAFRAARDQGYGIEFDLHLLKDGNIGILHDSNLKRMTGREEILEDLTSEDLKTRFLQGTRETIPTFSQVLALYQGTAPLIIELTSYEGNAALLTETACRMLKDYPGPYCLESFDPKCVLWLKKIRPDLIRGQLSENFLSIRNSPVPWILRFLGSYHLESFLTRPDFIAHKFCDRKTLSNALIRKFWKVPGIAWTIQNQQELETARKEGWIPIFEGFLPQ